MLTGANAQTMYASEATQATVGNTSTSLFKMAPSLFCAADKKGKEPYVDVDRYTTQFPNGDFRPKGCAKRGFGTSDFRAVDKYANTINTGASHTPTHMQRGRDRQRQTD